MGPDGIDYNRRARSECKRRDDTNKHANRPAKDDNRQVTCGPLAQCRNVTVVSRRSLLLVQAFFLFRASDDTSKPDGPWTPLDDGTRAPLLCRLFQVAARVAKILVLSASYFVLRLTTTVLSSGMQVSQCLRLV